MENFKVLLNKIQKNYITMNPKITMGNDEFILYIRKNYNCNVSNPQLGKLIWVWIRYHDSNAQQTEKDKACKWGDRFDNINGTDCYTVGV